MVPLYYFCRANVEKHIVLIRTCLPETSTSAGRFLHMLRECVRIVLTVTVKSAFQILWDQLTDMSQSSAQ